MRAILAMAWVSAAARSALAHDSPPPRSTPADPSSQESSAPEEPASSPQEPSAEDKQLLEEIEAATAAPPSSSPGVPDPIGALQQKPASLGISNLFNPAMSVNGLFLGAATSKRHLDEGELRTSLAIQELELQLTANVDPYFFANLILAMPEGEGIELEEGYVVPSEQPFGVQARIGKLKAPFGRENPLHAHALPFVDKSLAGEAVFGEEGLSEVGLELSYLFPFPWYSLLSGGVIDGGNEVVFGSEYQYDLAGYANLRNVFDLTDDATFELGGSYTAGNNLERDLSQVFGAHLVLRWRPAREAQTREAIVVVEGLWATRPNGGLAADDLAGGYAYAQWRLTQRWYTAARFDYVGLVDTGEREARGVTRRGSAIVVFAPTEFSAVRLQISAVEEPDRRHLVYQGLAQLNFTLGAHPAHTY